MKSVEEFDSLVGERLSAIKTEMQKKAEDEEKKRQEENEIFAGAIIELLCLETDDFSEYGKKSISHRGRVMNHSDYILGPEDDSKSSYIEINANGATIHLKYTYEQKYNPFLVELDKDLIDSLLAPYYVTIDYDHGGEYDCGQLIINYDHARKVREHSQDIPAEERSHTL